MSTKPIKPTLTNPLDPPEKVEFTIPGEISRATGRYEEAIAEYHIPIYAVIVKEDIGDAVSVMRKEISDSVDKVLERVKTVTLERTKEGDKIIIVGVGNTIGIGQ